MFEISSMGGLVLTQYIPLIERYFKIGKELTCYSDMTTLIKQIKFILLNENFANSVREKGWKRSLKDHSYENRIINIFKQIERLEKTRKKNI